jgi:MFS transporter, SP family, general alpha glucoside:H+ symporter
MLTTLIQSNILVSVLLPLMLGPKTWNWGAKTGFFWAGACALLFIWSYFRLPEPKDRINWELDVLFEQRISARKFASTNVDQFSKQEAEPDMMTPTNSAESGKQTHTKHEEGQVVNPER